MPERLLPALPQFPARDIARSRLVLSSPEDALATLLREMDVPGARRPRPELVSSYKSEIPGLLIVTRPFDISQQAAPSRARLQITSTNAPADPLHEPLTFMEEGFRRQAVNAKNEGREPLSNEELNVLFQKYYLTNSRGEHVVVWHVPHGTYHYGGADANYGSISFNSNVQEVALGGPRNVRDMVGDKVSYTRGDGRSFERYARYDHSRPTDVVAKMIAYNEGLCWEKEDTRPGSSFF